MLSDQGRKIDFHEKMFFSVFQEFVKLTTKEKKPIMVMFYAPCESNFCKFLPKSVMICGCSPFLFAADPCWPLFFLPNPISHLLTHAGPCLPLFNPACSCSAPFAPAHPCWLLFTSACFCLPLLTSAHPFSPLFTPAHPCSPLLSPAQPCSSLLTPAYSCLPLFIPAHSCVPFLNAACSCWPMLVCVIVTSLYLIIWISGCGYCKKLKPDYAVAATELKGEAVSFFQTNSWHIGWWTC